MDLIKITPDKERAKSIRKMTVLIEDRIKIQNRNKMSALIMVDYYEIIRELITAILLSDGYKTLGQKELFDFLKERCPEFNSHELSFMDDLRILRNKIAYDGFFTESSYLERNELLIRGIIKKLRVLLHKRGVA